MRIISIKTLKLFWEDSRYKDSEHSLRAWYAEAKKAVWENPSQIKITYRNASILSNNRVVFNIAGNKYRLVVAVNYDFGIIYIRFIGTHKQYDKIDVEVI
jgi:mRNA interferase HigB